jgi:N-methylhydantoinase A
MECPIYGRADLPQGCTLSGPVVVEEFGSTTVIQPGQAARVDRWGNLILEPNQ